MTALSTSPARPGPLASSPRRAGLAGTVRSELTKIISVRSTYWSLVLILLASVAWSVTFNAGTAAHWSHMSAQARAANDPAQNSVLGLALLGQLVIVVLGALSITSEYSTGMIRPSLIVMPRRLTLYGSKVLVFAAVAVATAIPAGFVCFFAGQEAMASTHAAAALGQPNVLRAVIASALCVVASGLLALGLGALLRNTAGTIAAAYGLLFLIPELARTLPRPWFDDATRWLPGGWLISQITGSKPQGLIPNMFSAWGELAVLGGYAAIALAAGAIALRLRDA